MATGSIALARKIAQTVDAVGAAGRAGAPIRRVPNDMDYQKHWYAIIAADVAAEHYGEKAAESRNDVRVARHHLDHAATVLNNHSTATNAGELYEALRAIVGAAEPVEDN